MQDNKKSSLKNLVIAILLIALIVSLVWQSKEKTKIVTEFTTKVETVSNEKALIQAEFIASSAKVDSLTASNVKLEGDLADKQNKLKNLKGQISTILQKKDVSDTELAQAKSLIAELNSKINNLVTDLAQAKEENVKLNTENQQLTTDKAQLTTDKQKVEENLTNTKKELDEKVDIASTLHASFFKLTAIRTKRNGTEKETSSAKRIDNFKVEFNLDDNRIAAAGPKDIYIIITDASGKIISDGATFTTREEGIKQYSDKMTINFVKGKTTPVSYKKPVKKLVPGNYLIQVYNNGFKIGEGLKELK